MTNFQTPSILRQVRETLGLSQASVARETGINRTYLSRFESGIQILSDEDLQSIQDHYVDIGFDFSEIAEIEEDEPELNDDGNPTVYRESCTIIDGFLVPDGIDPLEVEDLLHELKTHEDYIGSELNSAPKTGFFGGIDTDELKHRLLLIGLRGLRCYSIVQALKGREHVFSGLTSDIALNVKRDTLYHYLTKDEE